jgi:hypothetical protein
LLGCLMVHIREGQADILCNECSAVVRTVSVSELEATMLDLVQTDTICSARCTHCGALHTFPGFSVIEVFICSECGEAVDVELPTQ